MKIGNVIGYNGEIKQTYFNYSDGLIDNDLPTIIIGYSNAINIVGEDYVDTSTNRAGSYYWTCSIETDVFKHNSDLEIFLEICKNRFVKGFKIYTFDFFQEGYLDDFVLENCKVMTNNKSIFVKRNRCIYIMNPLYFKDFNGFINKWRGKFEYVSTVDLPFLVENKHEQLCFV